jgi:hypothetical protein
MDKENVIYRYIYTHTHIYTYTHTCTHTQLVSLSHREKWNCIVCRKMDGTRDDSEISQTGKDKYHIFSLLCVI